MDLWYSVIKIVAKTYMTLLIDEVQVQGKENLPAGPKIIVGNHPHVTDALALPFIVPEKIHFFIQHDTFTLPIIGKILEWADQIPVVIGQGQDALETARQKLNMGHSVGIFPEGRMSGSKEVRRAGAGRTCARSGQLAREVCTLLASTRRCWQARGASGVVRALHRQCC